MDAARSRRRWQVMSALVLTAVVAWTIAPTYPMRWMGDPNTGQDGPVSFHSWFSDLPFGYGAFHTAPTAICAIVAAAGAWYGIAVKRTRKAPAWWALAGAAILVGWSAVLRAWSWQETAAFVGLLVGAALILLAARRALPEGPQRVVS